MELSAKTLWPLFPLLLLVVVVCLTWAFVRAIRNSKVPWTGWVQGGALGSYLMAAVTAIASESGAISAHVHRPFSLLSQIFIVISVFGLWGKGERLLVGLNLIAWGAILSDTALHYLLAR
ncbi:MAG: hypothetical protein JSU59_03285 [Nitrospirota bacterium]|nr:MAG: hypothetical protein JSU59_03285 [Nitrospirota bacterium]